ncbi:MAG TPA: SpoIID/LytB domain-containing protein [Vicinamibacterales bacterium]|nr:SpoIID/LytB domain-containing protein [Vicinamibacterales bacterium]
MTAWTVRVVTTLGLLAIAACVAPRIPEAAPAISVPAQLRVRVGRSVRVVPIEEYVAGSALSEVSPTSATPATARRIFEVQAVLARTYATTHVGRHAREGFDLCDATHCQLYEPDRLRTSRFAALAREATANTAGLVIAFGNRPAEALFHADCGGHTASGEAVWGGAPEAYLHGVRDQVPGLTHTTWTLDSAPDELRRALAKDPRTDVGRRLDTIRVVRRDASDRASSIELRGEHTRVVRGEDFRAIVNATLGNRAVRSTRFAVKKTGGGFQLSGSGFGHGVGLCQVGAAARAKRGDSTGDIIGAYFRGARIVAATRDR